MISAISVISEYRLIMVEAENPIYKRKSAVMPTNWNGFRTVWQKLILILVFVLMSLPLFTTFNEILTRVVEKSGAYSLLVQNVVPFETRSVSVVLAKLGIKNRPTASHIFITRNNKNIGIFFSWNCLGWQSAILLLFTLIAGLSGGHPLRRKIETIILGITGTYLINLIRISTVVIVAYLFGQLPATVIHDYGGTLFTIAWFFFFWWFSYNYILEDR